MFNKLVKLSNDINLVCNVKTKTQSKHSVVQSTVLLLSWLFVFVLSLTLVCCINNKVNISNNLIAVEAVEDTGGEIDFRTNDASRDGSADKPYIIASAMNLRYLSNHQTEENFLSACYIQTADITYTSNTWTQIGSYSNNFTGTYDGGLYLINFTSDQLKHFSTFGYVSGSVINLGVKVNFNGEYIEDFFVPHADAGLILVLKEGGTMSACWVEGLINGVYDSDLASLVWSNYGTVTQCYANITKVVDPCYSDGSDFFGGLVGDNYGTGVVKDCYVKIEELNSARSYAICSNKGQVENCYVVVSNTGKFERVFDYNSNISNVSGIFVLQGICTYSYDGATQTSIEDMKKQETYQNAGWDFTEVWAIDENTNDGYPYLRAFDKSKELNINVETNVGAILNMSDEKGQNVQQIYVSQTTAQPIVLTMLPTTYIITITTYYTTNVEYIINNVTYRGNVITFNLSSVDTITIKLQGFVGNNGIII